MKSILLTILFWCLQFAILTAQNIADKDLSAYSYEELELNFNKTQPDTAKSSWYARAYLYKAKKDNDPIKVADAYYFLSEINSHTTLGLRYADSIIAATEKINHFKYPAQGYLQKGIQCYYASDHSLALENFIKANTLAITRENLPQQIAVKHYIGLLKNINNEVEEALIIFRDNFNLAIKNNLIETHKKQYLKSLFALADSYYWNEILDSAEVLSTMGIKESLKSDGKYLYPFFLISYGQTKSKQNAYGVALDSILKGAELIKNKKRELAGTYLVISSLYSESKQPENALRFLKKIDSMYKESPAVMSQAREAYEYMIRYYKSANDRQGQLETVIKLLYIDSIMANDYKDLSKQIIKKYETPMLIAEKEQLIGELQHGRVLSKNSLILSTILLIIFLGFLSYYMVRNITNKKRFQAIIESIEQGVDIPKKEGVKSEDANTIDLPEKMVNDILEKLEKFEQSKRFVKKNYTLNILAKELDTNSSYLSKIINFTKQVNFSNYLNDLKINFAIQKLRTDKQFRSYTIKAIAEEVGFNNAQSFSLAFHKKTGIYPSYFIKQTEQQNK